MPAHTGDSQMLSGVFVALATPWSDLGGVDEEGLIRLLNHVTSSGISGVCPVGSTGEGPHLSKAQRLDVVRIVQRELAGRLPCIPAVAATSLDDAREQLEQYAGLGATAALVAPPFYYPLSASATEDFFQRLADVAPIPLLLYNIPHLTKVALTAPMVAKLAKHPQVIGLKDSSRDLEFFQGVIDATRGTSFSVLTGTDTLLLASLVAGGDGTIAASANLVPSWPVELTRLVKAQDWAAARDLQFRLQRLVWACRRGSFPAGWKAALELAGICSGLTVPPTESLSAELRAGLQPILADFGLL